MQELKKIKEQYKNSLKSMDTEEFIDLAFYRPLGYLWALLCSKLGITPNVITIAKYGIAYQGKANPNTSISTPKITTLK